MSCWKVFCNVDLSLKKDALKELEKVADVTYFPAKQGTLLDNIANFDAYFASGFVVMNKEVFDNAKNLKVIASPGTGTDHINVNEAKKRGVDVLHLANELELLQGFTATAELAWALLLSCVRKCRRHLIVLSMVIGQGNALKVINCMVKLWVLSDWGVWER